MVNLMSLLPLFLQRFIADTMRPAAEPKPKHYVRHPSPQTPEQIASVKAYYEARKVMTRALEGARRDARRALLQRQSRRELDGFYTGPSLAMALAAQGSGKLTRRHKKDPAGKRRADNLIRVW
jgi:hypothetical protein